ncbi:MAG TPA: DUF1810 domain-containing protein [Candidatus Omnitrophota bacterium]|nr:DUF1810 domain-containing protein [Candidatus Omnitrophota bacterium]
MTDDPFELRRFVEAQQGVYETALAEIRGGRKETHWMWFVFPQLAGLGTSPISRRYAIRSAAEASAYLEHPVLGRRLRECAAAMNALPTSSAADVLGDVDAIKLRSSLTLFAHVPGAPAVFTEGLDKFFDGAPDPRTLQLLAGSPPSR